MRRRRHADYFLALAEELEPNLIGTGSHAAWLDRLERDHANFRAAFDSFEESVESDEALRLAAALWRFWDLRGHLVEGRRRLESALRADQRPTAARAKALGGAADMALTNGDVAAGGSGPRRHSSSTERSETPGASPFRCSCSPTRSVSEATG